MRCDVSMRGLANAIRLLCKIARIVCSVGFVCVVIFSVLYVWDNVIHNGYTHAVNVAYLEASLSCQSSCTGTVSDFLTKDVIAQVLGCTYAVNISVYLLWLFRNGYLLSALVVFYLLFRNRLWCCPVP